LSSAGRGKKRYRLGFDIGGTFTDFVIFDQQDGIIRISKCLTTPEDPSLGVVNGLNQIKEDFGLGMEEAHNAVHGTTLIINAIIERKGAKTGLITTRGFRDLLAFRRELRYDVYDMHLLFPEPLAPRYLRREVSERTAYDGSIIQPLDRGEVKKIAQELREQGVEAVAVCLLHSYANPEHEQEIGRILGEEAPRIHITLSSDLFAEWREYERSSVAVLNAYVQPIAHQYINRLDDRLKEQAFDDVWYVMASNGGVLARETAATYPARVLESGPVAGSLAAAYYGRLLGVEDLLSFDMGGTTAKSCLVRDGNLSITNDYEVARANRFKRGSGLPVRLPVVDMIEIGAGGGSIARLDEMGLISVGPDSAGADPGPVCYGFGGQDPTVTDAALILGYFNPDYFLGGRMKLNPEAANRAVEKIASPLGLSEAQAAWGIFQVVCTNMAEAARVYLAEKGIDARNLAMIAYGGAGPAHAWRVADILRIPRIICPRAPGVLAAFGFLTAPLSFDFVQSYIARLDEVDLSTLNEIYEEMTRRGKELMNRSGITEENITFVKTADLRYVGQGFEINIPMPAHRFTDADRGSLSETFHRIYSENYGRNVEEATVELINLRMLISASLPPVQIEAAGRGETKNALKGRRNACFGGDGAYLECPVYDRYKLTPGWHTEGPAIIEERECTIVVGPSSRASVDDHLNVIMDFQQRAGK